MTPSRVAVLGPTGTGKTHDAIERMPFTSPEAQA